MNAIQIFHADHKKLLDLFSKIVETTEQCLDLREHYFKEFELLMDIHFISEENIFYKRLITNPRFTQVIEKSYQVHHFGEIARQELRKLSFKDREWKPKFEALRDNIIQHLQEEEQVIYPKVLELYGEEELRDLGKEILEVRKEGGLLAALAEE